MDLDLSSLKAAIDRLAEVVAARQADPDNAFLRDAAIQRFEFTYELAHKMLRRYLDLTAADPQEIERMSFPNLIRTASEQELIHSDWERWHRWREARAKTSHTYDEGVAEDVAAGIPEFLPEVRFLFDQLRLRTVSE
jgi:nucleotidyltransferase substrate binding protein (TIGR01987 family)